MERDKFILWFEEGGKELANIIGKKCANLCEMTRLGLRVPPGFAISIEAYKKFVNETGVWEKMRKYVETLGKIEEKGIAIFEEMSQVLRGMIEEAEMPPDLEGEICSYYEALCERVGIPELPVSVRSAGVESRPGMFETYLNVKGAKEVIEKVKKVWASAYTARAIAFRVNKGLPILGDELGVAVVKMVNAKAAGVCFTVEPITGDRSKILIEANWGLGEGVVSGGEAVDRFIVDKNSLEIIEKVPGKKTKCVIMAEKGAEWREVPLEKQTILCLTDEEVREITRLGLLLEDHFGTPQDVEWSVDLDFTFPHNVFLLQTRPAKVVEKKSPEEELARRMSTLHREIKIDKAKLKEIQFKF